MIVFGACVGNQAEFESICLPGIARTFRDGDAIATTSSDRSIFEACNEILDAFRDRTDLEALVLLHDDTEITSPRFRDRVAQAFAAPDVAIAGVAGGSGMRGIAWWEGDAVGRVAETRGIVDFGGTSGDVDALDGIVLAFSPWSVRNLRFDDVAFTGFDGYDADICRQARAAGKRVRCTPLPVVHHGRGEDGRDQYGAARNDGGLFARADAVFRAKWDPHAGPAPMTGDEIAQVQGQWTVPLAALVPPGIRRLLDVGDDAAGRRDVLASAHPGCEVVPAATVADAPAGPFDVVMLADALEHTTAPDAMLAAARERLSDGGTVVFSVSNVASYAYLLHALRLAVHADHHAFPQSVGEPLHAWTRHEVGDAVARAGMTVTALCSNDWRPDEWSTALVGAVAAARPDGDAKVALAAQRFFVAAQVSPGSAAVAATAPRRGSVVDDGLVALVPPGATRVARVDERLGTDGDLVADADIAAAIASFGDAPYDAVVLGTALEHARRPSLALRAARTLVGPTGTVLVSVANAVYAGLFIPLLERDAWTYGEGPLAHHPVSFFTRALLRLVAADGGLLVARVDDAAGDADPGRTAAWESVGDELGRGPAVGQRIAVARMRVAMVIPEGGRRADPPAPSGGSR